MKRILMALACALMLGAAACQQQAGTGTGQTPGGALGPQSTTAQMGAEQGLAPGTTEQR